HRALVIVDSVDGVPQFAGKIGADFGTDEAGRAGDEEDFAHWAEGDEKGKSCERMERPALASKIVAIVRNAAAVPSETRSCHPNSPVVSGKRWRSVGPKAIRPTSSPRHAKQPGCRNASATRRDQSAGQRATLQPASTITVRNST